jgi:mono/diheme cytochrome c family protein
VKTNLASLVLLVGCIGVGGAIHYYRSGRTSTAPTLPPKTTRTPIIIHPHTSPMPIEIEMDAPAPIQGYQVWMQHCASCHGRNGDPTQVLEPGHMPPIAPPPADLRFKENYRHGASLKDVLNTTLNGVRATGMAPYKDRLTKQEAEFVAAFVVSIQRHKK